MIELYVVTKNACKCKKCGSVIESKNRHDFVECSCKSIFTDGGTEYVRRGAEDFNLIEDMTEYRDKTLEELHSDLSRMRESNLRYSCDFYPLDALQIVENRISELEDEQ